MLTEYPSFGYGKQAQYQTKIRQTRRIVSIWCSMWCSIR